MEHPNLRGPVGPTARLCLFLELVHSRGYRKYRWRNKGPGILVPGRGGQAARSRPTVPGSKSELAPNPQACSSTWYITFAHPQSPLLGSLEESQVSQIPRRDTWSHHLPPGPTHPDEVGHSRPPCLGPRPSWRLSFYFPLHPWLPSRSAGAPVPKKQVPTARQLRRPPPCPAVPSRRRQVASWPAARRRGPPLGARPTGASATVHKPANPKPLLP